MNLIDAGPLVAMNDQGDPFHGTCLSTLAQVQPARFATTWPCVAEAMHLLGRAGGFPLQAALWRMIRGDLVTLIDLSPEEVSISEAMMDRYQDHPMDLADATLVALANNRGRRTVFTLDADYFSYRLRNGGAMDIIRPAQS